MVFVLTVQIGRHRPDMSNMGQGEDPQDPEEEPQMPIRRRESLIIPPNFSSEIQPATSVEENQGTTPSLNSITDPKEEEK